MQKLSMIDNRVWIVAPETKPPKLERQYWKHISLKIQLVAWIEKIKFKSHSIDADVFYQLSSFVLVSPHKKLMKSALFC